MELINEVYEAINRYFSALSHTGYKPDNEVYKLLIFTFLEELLYGPLSQYITEDDYVAINNSLYCLYGSCIIPFPNYKKSFDTTINRMSEEYRVTEENIMRGAETLGLRVKS